MDKELKDWLDKRPLIAFRRYISREELEKEYSLPDQSNAEPQALERYEIVVVTGARISAETTIHAKFRAAFKAK